MMNTHLLAGGFTDAPAESAIAFRTLLNAMANPGQVQAQPLPLDPPAPMTANTTAAILTLVDNDTPLWLCPTLGTGDIQSFLKFHTGAPITDDIAQAAFVVATTETVPDLKSLPIGTAEYPDRSATLIIQAAGDASGATVTLSGPGIRDRQELSIAGLQDGFWQAAQLNNALFPLGADFIFACQDGIAACPRSVTITMAEKEAGGA